MMAGLLSSIIRASRPHSSTHIRLRPPRRHFHDYFVTRLPSSSLHPDSRSSTGLAHKFPRKDSTPHQDDGRRAPIAHPTTHRDTTTVRIPLKSAKHHYGVAVSRGSRPYNEDTHQAGVIELPAFAKRPPVSLRLDKKTAAEGTSADGASGDPQVFYFGVFDGHGGAECSDYLKEKLHQYIESAATDFELKSSLKTSKGKDASGSESGGRNVTAGEEYDKEIMRKGKEALKNIDTSKSEEASEDAPSSEPVKGQAGNTERIHKMEKDLIKGWRELVSGYWRRAKPPYFSIFHDVDAGGMKRQSSPSTTSIEEVLSYSFLKADYDFVSAQAAKAGQEVDSVHSERPLNDGDILGSPNRVAEHKSPESSKQFKGGSTCSIVLVSTPSPVPFWNPASTSTLLVSHVGDTRIIVSSTATGAAHALTTHHHPSSPIEATRLRRYAATFTTDSFGEERISGLANTRAFGDMASKRIGVSAEPEIRRIEVQPAEFAFMVLCSDGVNGTLADQEIVDIVKESQTPEKGARSVVDFATEVSADGDNATCLVVRLGGWERRQEGGLGSMGTKEARDYKRDQANDPRSSRR